jgi:hypothetical protein
MTTGGGPMCPCPSEASHDDGIRAFEAAVHDEHEAISGHYQAYVMMHPNPQLVLGACTHWIDAAMKVVGTDLKNSAFLDPKTNQPVEEGPVAWAMTLVHAWVNGDVAAYVNVLEDMPFRDGPVAFFWAFDMCVRICRDDYTLMWKDCGHHPEGCGA